MISFDPKTALLLAKCCQVSYSAFPSQQVDNLHVTVVESHGRCCLIEANGQLVLTFRGTDSLLDWEIDARAKLVQNSLFKGKVHEGFGDRFAQLVPWFVEQNIDKSRPIYVTGHSLGAALATLCSEYLLGLGYTVLPVYTFGSPRIGNTDFVDHYDCLQYRIVHDLDIIQHLPSAWHYCHVTDAITISDDGSVIYGNTWLNSIISLWARIYDKGLITTLGQELSEHSIQTYVNALSKVKSV